MHKTQWIYQQLFRKKAGFGTLPCMKIQMERKTLILPIWSVGPNWMHYNLSPSN